MALGFANYKLDDLIAIARAQCESQGAAAIVQNADPYAWVTQDAESEACPALDCLRPGAKITDLLQPARNPVEEEISEVDEDTKPDEANAWTEDYYGIDEPYDVGNGEPHEQYEDFRTEEEEAEEEERRKWEEVVNRRGKPAQPRARSPSPPSPPSPRRNYQDYSDEASQMPVSFSVDGYFPKVPEPQRTPSESRQQNLPMPNGGGAVRKPALERSMEDTLTRAPSSSSSAASSTATTAQATWRSTEWQSSAEDEIMDVTEELPPIEEDDGLGDEEWEKRWAKRTAAYEDKQRCNTPAPKEEPLPPKPLEWTPHAAGFGPRCCIAGTWDHWKVRDMRWDKNDSCYTFNICLGANGWESFQIVYDGDWNKCLHPDKADASIHTGFDFRGPDSYGNGKNWTIGKNPLDGGYEGAIYKVRLFLDASQHGQPCRLDWMPLDEEDVEEAAAPAPAPVGRDWQLEADRTETGTLRDRLALAKKRSSRLEMQHRRKVGPNVNLFMRPLIR